MAASRHKRISLSSTTGSHHSTSAKRITKCHLIVISGVFVTCYVVFTALVLLLPTNTDIYNNSDTTTTSSRNNNNNNNNLGMMIPPPRRQQSRTQRSSTNRKGQDKQQQQQALRNTAHAAVDSSPGFGSKNQDRDPSVIMRRKTVGNLGTATTTTTAIARAAAAAGGGGKRVQTEKQRNETTNNKNKKERGIKDGNNNRKTNTLRARFRDASSITGGGGGGGGGSTGKVDNERNVKEQKKDGLDDHSRRHGGDYDQEMEAEEEEEESGVENAIEEIVIGNDDGDDDDDVEKEEGQDDEEDEEGGEKKLPMNQNDNDENDNTTDNAQQKSHHHHVTGAQDEENNEYGRAATDDYTYRAYLEPINQEDWKIKPLPVRTSTALELTEISYPRINSCSKLPELLPVDDYPNEDPFLPWIHDVFPTHDGKFIQFVAQNKRRCQTGRKLGEIRKHMQPQAALFQHVPIKRIRNDEHDAKNDEINDGKEKASAKTAGVRYRLSSYEEADPDGTETRFICRFKPTMEETLSVHNIDYDYAAWRKAYQSTFTEEGFDVHMIFTSQLLFRCPVPPSLQTKIRNGSTVINDYAALFVDVIPIRTPPRYGPPTQFLSPKYKPDKPNTFVPDEEWGREHILPKIEDSGRWENIPICMPSLMTYHGEGGREGGDGYNTAAAITTDEDTNNNGEHDDDDDNGNSEGSVHGDINTAIKRRNKEEESLVVVSQETDDDEPVVPKKHRLIACTWASAEFHTRGERAHIDDGKRLLKEWITFNLLSGFDHVYVYDNSGAFSETESLQSVADSFPKDKVTRINWPCKVCNNNKNNVDNKGERSSQYAAESSCLLRFGPHTDWLAAFDYDEYLIPLGNHNSMTGVLDKLDEEGMKILAFRSWRSWPRRDFIEEPKDSGKCPEPCFEIQLLEGKTFLQTYNCEREKGQKISVVPAEKQIYRPDYVLQHFVHYSTVTTEHAMSKAETENAGIKWKRRYNEQRSRYSDEIDEATMLHTKTIAMLDTQGWERACKSEDGFCRLGTPFPPGLDKSAGWVTDPDGWGYNCFINEKVENVWVPKLIEAMGRSD